mmetsp:Transcript_85847/g.195708  ORF Transcript_85847/g.195708 Transcript_85847/m.195708 type:complete len:715 (-) Transcript_85847:175-2319(-)|eukprot:CAMPEP_0204317780 /NCGR_PEP_ID=MMETSP0469-20131031/6162_1 /ASSEMBLY_ACC=CAM_ASM_000384 /TAXON_ID=2969 /ORGANISM="Oxyrrhis marina" /LENGTH=714 /DNA_ID=CAMNT_0051298743 /DNA_START=60 /DNA_END=2204 /DNA_ORIENTATION=+
MVRVFTVAPTSEASSSESSPVTFPITRRPQPWRQFAHRVMPAQLLETLDLVAMIPGNGARQQGVSFRVREKAGRRRTLRMEMVEGDAEAGLPYNVLREVAILSTLSHRGVQQVVAATGVEARADRDVHGVERLILPTLLKVVDWADSVTLYQHLRMGQGGSCAMMPVKPRKEVMRQVLGALDFIHSKGVVHRNLKPSSILVQPRQGMAGYVDIKLTNFKCARELPNRTATDAFPLRPISRDVITEWYRCPELILQGGDRTTETASVALYGSEVDVWSAGVIFLELSIGRPAFASDSEIFVLYQIFKRLGTPTEAVWPGLTQMDNYSSQFPRYPGEGFEDAQCCGCGRDMLSSMLKYDPAKRITAAVALHHRFMWLPAGGHETAVEALQGLPDVLQQHVMSFLWGGVPRDPCTTCRQASAKRGFRSPLRRSPLKQGKRNPAGTPPRGVSRPPPTPIEGHKRNRGSIDDSPSKRRRCSVSPGEALFKASSSAPTTLVRRAVVEQIMRHAWQLKVASEALFLAVWLFDRVTAVHTLKDHLMIPMGLSCLMAASKVEDIEPIAAADWRDLEHDPSLIADLEITLLKVVGAQLLPVEGTAYMQLQRLAGLLELNREQFLLAHFLLELGMLEADPVRPSPHGKVAVCQAVYQAKQLLQPDEDAWTARMELKTGVSVGLLQSWTMCKAGVPDVVLRNFPQEEIRAALARIPGALPTEEEEL